jgi:integrase
VRWNLIPHNPADAVKAPTPEPKEMHPLSAQEARRLLSTARDDRLEALYALAVHTGMRRGELLALRWSDVSLGEPGTETGAVRVRRTLTRTEDGNGITLGEPKTKKSGAPYA